MKKTLFNRTNHLPTTIYHSINVLCRCSSRRPPFSLYFLLCATWIVNGSEIRKVSYRLFFDSIVCIKKKISNNIIMKWKEFNCDAICWKMMHVLFIIVKKVFVYFRVWQWNWSSGAQRILKTSYWTESISNHSLNIEQSFTVAVYDDDEGHWYPLYFNAIREYLNTWVLWNNPSGFPLTIVNRMRGVRETDSQAIDVITSKVNNDYWTMKQKKLKRKKNNIIYNYKWWQFLVPCIRGTLFHAPNNEFKQHRLWLCFFNEYF